MTDLISSESSTSESRGAPVRKARPHVKPQLRVVLDTSVLYTGSASDLVRQEVASIIQDSKYPDLDINWYLPDIVRHERQYQMRAKGAELLPSIQKVERLLGHNLNITEEILRDRVEKVISTKMTDLGLQPLSLDVSKVDWHRLMIDASYRNPPFEAGKKEKGFRDALLVETFLQFVEISPRTPKVCRLVLVTEDEMMTTAVDDRIAEIDNATVSSGLEDLRGLINTLVSAVDEDFIALLKPKAKRMFFVPKDESTIFYKDKIRHAITQQFSAELGVVPQGATYRANGKWTIRNPNFAKKVGQRIHWASRIEVEAEASIVVKDSPTAPRGLVSSAGQSLTDPSKSWLQILSAPPTIGLPTGSIFTSGQFLSGSGSIPVGSGNILLRGPRSVITHQGVDTFEVNWSTEVTTAKELRRAKIEEIRHVEIVWEAVG